MSATLDSDLFARYYGGCPVLAAGGRTFPVEHLFLEDAYELTGCAHPLLPCPNQNPCPALLGCGHHRAELWSALHGSERASVRANSQAV